MNNFEYVKAKNAADAIEEACSANSAAYVAGGTNVIDLWKYNVANPERWIDINGVDEHAAVQLRNDGGIRLSAFATNADTAWHPLVAQQYPLLSRAILAGASAQIRNMATNGGNLLQRTRCYYFYDPDVPCNKRRPGSGCPAREGFNRMHAILGCSDDCIAVFPSDMCVALAALDAVVNVSGPSADRSIDFADFHRLPGDRPELDNTLQQHELITSIDLPPNDFSSHYSYLKLRDRHSYAFALVSVAMAFKLENGVISDARIALGGVAHKPWRLPEAEAVLAGNAPTESSFARAADILLAGARGFKHNAFKIELARRAIIRTGMMALHPETQLPGAQPSK